MKSCEQIVFYCESEPLKETLDGKNVYASWPRLPHYDAEGPRRWATTYQWHEDRTRTEVPGFEVTMDNKFESAMIFDEVNSRGQSAKVPQAVVYCTEKDCYLKFDFRTDGLVETLCNSIVEYGVIMEPMSFRFAGANYFFVPREGKTFTEFRNSFEQAQKPKTKQSTEIEVGVPFVGSFDIVYRYLGAFKCEQDDNYDPEGRSSAEKTDYTGKTVHVYHSCRDYGFRNSVEMEEKDPSFHVSKSKMSVKSLTIPEDFELFVTPNEGVVTTECGTKGSYGTGFNIKLEVDFENRTVKYVKKTTNRQGGMCGWPRFG